MHTQNSGFTLLEVLVAVVILSIGMLGVGAVLATVHHSTASSYLAQQSAQLAANIIERMRQNPTAAQALDYNVTYAGGALAAPTPQCDSTGTPCSASQQAKYDLYQWLSNVNASLPGANATVVVNLTPSNSYDATVTVSYNDAPAAQAAHAATTRRTFQLETLL